MISGDAVVCLTPFHKQNVGWFFYLFWCFNISQWVWECLWKKTPSNYLINFSFNFDRFPFFAVSNFNEISLICTQLFGRGKKTNVTFAEQRARQVDVLLIENYIFLHWKRRRRQKKFHNRKYKMKQLRINCVFLFSLLLFDYYSVISPFERSKLLTDRRYISSFICNCFINNKTSVKNWLKIDI